MEQLENYAILYQIIAYWSLLSGGIKLESVRVEKWLCF